MLYRDLIPGRLGGRYIASHITIPEGGPVADWVHYHRIALSDDLCPPRLGSRRLRGPGRAVRDARRRPRPAAAGDPPPRARKLARPGSGRDRLHPRSTRPSPTMIWSCRTAPTRARVRRPTLPAPRRGDRRRGPPVAAAKRRRRHGRARRSGLAEVRTSGPAMASRRVPPHDGELVFGFVLDGSARLDYRRTHRPRVRRRFRRSRPTRPGSVTRAHRPTSTLAGP